MQPVKRGLAGHLDRKQPDCLWLSPAHHLSRHGGCIAPRSCLGLSTLGYLIDLCINTLYIRFMLTLFSIGEQIAIKRKALGLTQFALAKKARIGLSTLDALENGRLGELGYSKVTNILSAIGLALKLQEASARRPTLDQLMEEERDDKGLDRRG
jgi:DNA-binding XRE family transcriptional regulator